MGADCFDHPRAPTDAGPLLRFVGVLRTAVFAAVIDGLRAIRQEWSAFGSTGVRWYGTSSILPVSASLTPAQEKDDFLPALLLPRYLSPRYLKDAGDSGSRALAPLEIEQGTVFIGIALLKSRLDAIITYLFRRVNTNLILRSDKGSCVCVSNASG